jgi:hypothetical protein
MRIKGGHRQGTAWSDLEIGNKYDIGCT